MFSFIFCVDLVTLVSFWCNKGLLYTWPTKPCIDFLQCMIRHLPLRNFACKFRLLNVSKPKISCHNRMYRVLGDRGHPGATRIRQFTRCVVHWLILMAPSCLRSHNVRCIMLKCLNFGSLGCYENKNNIWQVHSRTPKAFSYYAYFMPSFPRVCQPEQISAVLYYHVYT